MVWRRLSTRAVAFAVAGALMVSGVVLGVPPAAAVPPTPFYEVPDPLPPGAPGALIKAELVADGAVRTFRVMYHSRSLPGADIAVTGLVHVPVGVPAPPGGREIVSVAHGSVGSADQCAPSLQVPLNPRFAPWLDRGYIVAETDYEGLGPPGPHPHLVGESEARGIIDIVRAARALPGAEAGSRYVASGFSQGGHGVLFVGEVAATWAPELTLLGVNAEAPGTELPLAAVALSKLPGGAPAANVLITAIGIAAAYPEASLDQVLTPLGLSLVPLAEQYCYWQLADLVEAEGGGPAMFRAIESAPPWDELLLEVDPGHRPTPVPIRIWQGAMDATVLPFLTEVLFDRLCGLGDEVVRELAPGELHEPSDAASLAGTVPWVIDRFEGVPFASTCPPVHLVDPVPSTTTAAAPTAPAVAVTPAFTG